MPEISEVLKNPTAYGFRWSDVEIATGGQGDKGTSLGTVPCPYITDDTAFAHNFPGILLRYLNGSSSIRVKVQGVGRTARLKDSRITNEALKPVILAAVLGSRTRAQLVVEVHVYPLPDGTTTKDLAEFKAAYGIEE